MDCKWFCFVLYFILLHFHVNCKRNLYYELKKYLADNPFIKQNLLNTNISPKDLFTAYSKCTKGPIKKSYLNFSPFSIEEPDLCKGKVSIIVGIHSTYNHKENRDLIRQTYGSVKRIENFIIRYVFVVGNANTSEEQQEIEKESRQNHDIIQKGFRESYRNMTLKHLALLEWINKHCSNATYLLKTDDDVFIDLFHLVRVIKDGFGSSGYMCSSTKGVKPIRNTKSSGLASKWYVTKEEYGGKYYPTYCEGYGYLIRIKPNIAQIYACSIFNRPFWIDDVYVAGVLPEMLRIPRRGFEQGSGYNYMRPNQASSAVLNAIFYVAYWSQLIQNQWFKMWQSVITYSMTL